ncbi:MAG TPA: EamA family transporter, partial [Ktedonobacteraceae bacterium]|nr:EamA family transporter [Ktedonobacteraceae bacterium]
MKFTQVKSLQGLAFANVAVLCFGLAGVLGKLSALPAPTIVFGRTFFAGLVLLAVCWFRRVPLRAKRSRDSFLLVGQGLLLAFHWTAFFQAINVSNVAIGLLSFSSFPLFTAALEPLLLHQRPGRTQIVAALLILLGIYVLVPSFTLQNTTTLGVLWGVLAGASFALLSVTNRWLGRTYSSLMISLYQDGIAAIVLIPALFFTPIGAFRAPHELLILLLLGVVCTALAHTLFIASLNTITAQTASLLASLEPVWGILFGVILLGNIPTASTLIGGALIVGAILVPGIVALLWPSVNNTD